MMHLFEVEGAWKNRQQNMQNILGTRSIYQEEDVNDTTINALSPSKKEFINARIKPHGSNPFERDQQYSEVASS